jgi:hypothetical protein
MLGLGTYNCNLATKLIFDLALLDCTRRMLLDQLVQMFDTHGEMIFADWMVWWCF